LTCSTHVYAVMNFPSASAGEKDEQVKLIVAGVFLRRFISDLPSANLLFIALVAVAFFWVVGEIGCRWSLDAAVFRLFGNADLRITASGAIRVEGIEKSNPDFFSRTDNAGVLLLL